MACELIPIGPLPIAHDEEIARLEDQLGVVIGRMEDLPKGAELFNAEQERRALVVELWRAKGWADPPF